jgi:TrmH family RNA methyltransferase
MFHRITSPDNSKIKNAIWLHDNRGRRKQGRIIIFGRTEIQRAIDSGLRLEELFLNDEESLTDCQSIAEQCHRQAGTAVYQLPPKLFSKLVYGDRGDGMIAVAQRPRTQLADLPNVANSLVIVLNAIEKPGNIGAVFRTADAAAVNAVLITDPVTDQFHPNSIRASVGTVFSMASSNSSSSEARDFLRNNGYQILMAVVGAKREYLDVDMTGRTAIVLGNESQGLPGDWTDCENDGANIVTVQIPMAGLGDSLNLSVTSAIMIFEAVRQRREAAR